MRPTFAFVPLALLLVLPFLAQDPETGGGEEATPDDAPVSRFDVFFTEEQVRIEKEIEGTWILQEFQPPNALFDSADVRGVAMFRDGYLSVNIMAQTFVPEFFGDGAQLYVQGGAHRYRISEFLELQTATIIGYQNFDDEDDLLVEPSGLPREYRVDIDEEGAVLSLTGLDGTKLIWSRLGETEFPSGSLEALNAVRGR